MRKNLTRDKKVLGRKTFKELFESPSTKIVKEWGLKLLFKENSLNQSRFGIVLARGFPNAVRRNRCKRCVRELLRENYYSLPQGFDLVFVLYPSFKETNCSEALRRLLLKSSVPYSI